MNILLIAITSDSVHRIFLIPSEELKKYDMKELDDKWCWDQCSDDPPLSDLWYRLDTDLKKYEDPPMPCSFDDQYLINTL